MAAILEDEDLIAQAQERERARLEEEAAILAFQQQQQAALPPPVWAGSPEVVIDEFNAQPGMVSAPTTIGSEQYMNELARAQRGSGFINADVGPMGNVITPGYDPSRDFAALKAQQEATNLQRNQYVDSLIQGGATYAEAYRAGQGRYPQARNDAMRLKVEQLAQRTQPFTPRVQTIGGVPMVERARGQWSPLQQPKFVGGKVTPAIRAQEDNLVKQIAALRRELTPRGALGELLAPPGDADAIKAEIARKEKERVDLMSRPEVNPNIDQAGYAQMRQAWENPVSSQAPVPAVATPVSETITVTTKEQFSKLPSGSVYTGKDGKKYRKP